MNKRVLILLLSSLLFSCGQDSDVKRGKEFLEIKDYNRAIEHFNKAVENDPKNFEAHLNLAKVYDLLNNKQSAFNEYQYAFHIDSTNYELLFSFGGFLHRQNLKTESIRLFNKLLNLSRDEKYIIPIAEITGLIPFKYDLLAHKIQEGYKQDFKYVTYDNDVLVYATWLQGGGIGRSLIYLYNFKIDSLHQISPNRYDVFESLPFVDFNRKIIYYAIIDNHRNEICSINFDGSDSNLLVRTIIEGYSTDPGRIRSSPDGSMVLFTASAHQSGKEILYRISGEGNDFFPITSIFDQTLTWSTLVDFTFFPDSKKLAIFKPVGYNDQRSIYFNLYSYDFNLNEFQQIINSPIKNPTNLCLSNDGKIIAFIEKSSYDQSNLYIYNIGNDSLFSLKDVNTYAFSSFSEEILFCKNDSIFTSSVSNFKPRLISVIKNSSSNLLAIARDGKSIIYNMDNNIIKIELPLKNMQIEDFMDMLSKH